ncbi:hypothetical protein Tco_1524016 [Tanacetum coccineum]
MLATPSPATVYKSHHEIWCGSVKNRSRRGYHKWLSSCALRNFDLGENELENSQNNALAKFPMSKLGEYEMWEEIRITASRFGGNDATKKTQKALLKQQYENFNATSSESLDSIFNSFKSLLVDWQILECDTLQKI